MDAGTAKDHIEDLMMQVQNITAQRDRYMARLFECQQERDRWRKLAERTMETLSDAIGAMERIKAEAEQAAADD